MKAFVIILAALFGVARPLLVPELSELWVNIFKDMAHVYMGSLLVLWLLSWRDERSLWKGLFWTLNVVEVISAIFSRLT